MLLSHRSSWGRTARAGKGGWVRAWVGVLARPGTAPNPPMAEAPLFKLWLTNRHGRMHACMHARVQAHTCRPATRRALHPQSHHPPTHQPNMHTHTHAPPPHTSFSRASTGSSLRAATGAATVPSSHTCTAQASQPGRAGRAQALAPGRRAADIVIHSARAACAAVVGPYRWGCTPARAASRAIGWVEPKRALRGGSC